MKDNQENHFEENQPLKVLRDVLIDRSSRWLADFPLGGLAEGERSEEEEREHKKEEGQGTLSNVILWAPQLFLWQAFY